jgi:hypothetical protein
MKKKMLASALLDAACLIASQLSFAGSHTGCADITNYRLTVKMYHLELNDRAPVCMTAPGSFDITIHNPVGSDHDVEVNDVTVSNKGTDCEVEISGQNSDTTDPLTVTVNITDAGGPNECKNDDGDYAFLISVEGVGELDPAVRVIDSTVLLDLQWHAVNETLDAWYTDYESLLRATKSADKSD